MYQSASIAGNLSGVDSLALGEASPAQTAPAWARPGQAARWAAAAPKPLSKFISGPELTESDKPCSTDCTQPRGLTPLELGRYHAQRGFKKQNPFLGSSNAWYQYNIGYRRQLDRITRVVKVDPALQKELKTNPDGCVAVVAPHRAFSCALYSHDDFDSNRESYLNHM